jgi:hypothetical protein
MTALFVYLHPLRWMARTDQLTSFPVADSEERLGKTLGVR